MKLGYLRVGVSQRAVEEKISALQSIAESPGLLRRLSGRVVLPVLTGVAAFERPRGATPSRFDGEDSPWC